MKYTAVRECTHNKGKSKKTAPLHYCPYQHDINDNPDPNYCNCCQECRQECADDI